MNNPSSALPPFWMMKLTEDWSEPKNNSKGKDDGLKIAGYRGRCFLLNNINNKIFVHLSSLFNAISCSTFSLLQISSSFCMLSISSCRENIRKKKDRSLKTLWLALNFFSLKNRPSPRPLFLVHQNV